MIEAKVITQYDLEHIRSHRVMVLPGGGAFGAGWSLQGRNARTWPHAPHGAARYLPDIGWAPGGPCGALSADMH